MSPTSLGTTEPGPSPESRQYEGFTFVRESFTFVQGGLTFKFDKSSTNL